MCVNDASGKKNNLEVLRMSEYKDRKEERKNTKEQKTAAKDEPSVEDLYQVGCIANILQMLKLPDGTVNILQKKIVKYSQIWELIH